MLFFVFIGKLLSLGETFLLVNSDGISLYGIWSVFGRLCQESILRLSKMFQGPTKLFCKKQKSLRVRRTFQSKVASY